MGNQQWVDRYHGGTGDDLAYDLVADASDSVYVTGETVGSGTALSMGQSKYGTNGSRCGC